MSLDGGHWLEIRPIPAPTYPTAAAIELCSARVLDGMSAYMPSMEQCPYRESGGARCELEHGHKGGHDFTDALFLFIQARYGDLQGPRCLTRRGPKQYIWIDGPLCL